MSERGLTNHRVVLAAKLPGALIVDGGVLVGLLLLHDEAVVFIRLTARLTHRNRHMTRFTDTDKTCDTRE